MGNGRNVTRILAVHYPHTLIQMPRYNAFRDALLTTKKNIVEVSGQKYVLVQILAAKSWNPSHLYKLSVCQIEFEREIATDPNNKFVYILIAWRDWKEFRKLV